MSAQSDSPIYNCPRCGKGASDNDFHYVSRTDDQTEICYACYNREGELLNSRRPVTPQDRWPIGQQGA